MIKQLCFLISFSFLLNTSIAQITITLTSLPENTPTTDKIFLAGNINGWNPNDNDFVFEKTGHHYTITFTPLKNDVVEFKCTRGNWEKVEGDKEGSAISNHAIIYEGKPIELDIQIESWEDLDGKPAVSTASKNVSIISEEFFIPQLNRKRRVWIYLPPNYHLEEDYYPVLYMHDGQNVFDELTSYAGEWKVDETLDELYAKKGGCIIVAVDNAEEHRKDEYSPWKNDEYGGGEGAAYVEFLVETLKPFIDENYKTLSDRENTGIMGSSMGGLISLYAGLEFPEVFSKLGVFSPAFWFSDECYQHAKEKASFWQTYMFEKKVFFLIGRLEGERYVFGMAAMYNTLLDAGFKQEDMFYLVDEEGQHNEAFWARQFPKAFDWLFNVADNEYQQSELPIIQFSRKKKDKFYYVDVSKDLGEIEIEIIRPKKKTRTITFKESGRFPLKYLGKKQYQILVKNKKGILLKTVSFNPF